MSRIAGLGAAASMPARQRGRTSAGPGIRRRRLALGRSDLKDSSCRSGGRVPLRELGT